MILYACPKCGPLATMKVKGPFDLKITCRLCGGFGLPVQQPSKFTKNEQVINACQMKGG
jgi:hypothetical protein